MKEIKFRFWSKILNHFIIPDDDIFVGALKDSNMGVMQYTGLKDKNGKEIYEGDIINFPMFDSGGHIDHFCKGEVVWNQEHLTYEIGQRIGTAQYAKPDRKCEVIGNIWENPELIEGDAEEVI